MLQLILQSLRRRRIQSSALLLSVLISVAVLFALYLVYTGVTGGLNTSEERLGADIVVMPRKAASLLSDSELLFTGAAATVYMDADEEALIANIDGVVATTSQFYSQTLDQGCCSTITAARLLGYDPASDWVIAPWAQEEIGRELAPDEIVIGSHIGGYESGRGYVLGKPVTVVAVLAPTGTSLDYSILMSLAAARAISADTAYYEHFWERYGAPANLISAVLVKVADAYDKNNVANLIELKGDYTTVVASDALVEAQSQAGIIFRLMFGACLLFCVACVFQLLARFYSMAWDRKNELGLYRALGASAADLRTLIAGEALILIGAGAICGLLLGYLFYRLIHNLLVANSAFPFIAPSCWLALAGVAGVLLLFVLIGLAAVYVPLKQVKKIDPSLAMQKMDID